MREPWWRKQTQHWYVKRHGRQERLSEEPDPDGGSRKQPPPAVVTAWHKLLATDEPRLRRADMTVAEAFGLFLETRAGLPDNGTGWCLGNFRKHVGADCKASTLRPYHLTQLFKKNPQWGESTQRTVTCRVLAALNYAVREGLLDRNPISSTPGYRRHGSYARRKGVVSPALRQALEARAAPALRAFLAALRLTGCRPSELRRARIERCLLDEGVLYVPNKTAKKTGEPERKIYLTEEARELVRGLTRGRTEGFIFLTVRGRPWKHNNLEGRWAKLTEEVPVPKGITLYSYRRSFISTAINEKNVNPALVAQLAGHVDLTMLLKHYLEEDPDALRKAVEAVTKKGEPPPAAAP